MSTPKLMPLTEWAAARYTTPPSLYVLRQLCRRGMLELSQGSRDTPRRHPSR